MVSSNQEKLMTHQQTSNG